jgi:hypothetical protein
MKENEEVAECMVGYGCNREAINKIRKRLILLLIGILISKVSTLSQSDDEISSL